MIVGTYHFRDDLYNTFDEETKLKVDEAIRQLTSSDSQTLNKALAESFLKKAFNMEDTKKLSKAEKRKLRREKKKAQAQPMAEEPKVEAPEFTPLDQSFGAGKLLSQVLDPKTDVYLKERRTKEGKQIVTEKRWLIRRDAVRKIADAGDIVSFSKTTIFSPTIDNNYLVAFDVTVTDKSGKSTTMLGEASNENTRGISRMYKALTAERRGYVRAVLTHLNLRNLYGEDEFVEEEVELEEDAMPSKEEFDGIEKHINAILNAASKEDLVAAGDSIKSEVETLSDKQMNYLRELYKKYLAKFESI